MEKSVWEVGDVEITASRVTHHVRVSIDSGWAATSVSAELSLAQASELSRDLLTAAIEASKPDEFAQ